MPRPSTQRSAVGEPTADLTVRGVGAEESVARDAAMRELFLLVGELAVRSLASEYTTLEIAVSAIYANVRDNYANLVNQFGPTWAKDPGSVARCFVKLQGWYNQVHAAGENVPLFAGGPGNCTGLTTKGKEFFYKTRIVIDEAKLAELQGQSTSANSPLEHRAEIGHTGRHYNKNNDIKYVMTGDSKKDNPKGGFQEKVRSKSKNERPQINVEEETPQPITSDEVRQVELDVAQLQAPAVRRFQEVLHKWAGRRTGSNASDKELAEHVMQIAVSTGSRLFFNGKPVSLRWNAGVFVVFSADHAKKYLGSSRELMPLEAKPIVDTGTPGDQEQGQETVVPPSPPEMPKRNR